MIVAAAVALAFVSALLASGLYGRLARRFALMDIPNERSAHLLPVPRGGGIGIFLGVFLAVLLLALLGVEWPAPYPGLLGLSGFLLIAGVIDDRLSVPVAVRLPVYALACGFAVWLALAPAPLWLMLSAGLYALWVLNLFNFMDGIDGIAAAEATFAFAIAALLALWSGGTGAYPLLCLLLAASCLAFLHWNWAPALLFMGDAGSIPLGFLLAMLSLEGQASGSVSLASWLILLAVFIADATYTLCWRALRRESVTQAHSRHMYQRLARHWRSHARVVQAMLLFNVFWLAPLAFAAMLWPGSAWLLVIAAYLPLLPALLKAGKLP